MARICILFCVLVLLGCVLSLPHRAILLHTTQTVTLSVARRDLGGAAIFTDGVGRAVFAGGCTLHGRNSDTPFICNLASDNVDIIEAGSWKVVPGPPLSTARGWVATCSSEDGQMYVVFFSCVLL